MSGWSSDVTAEGRPGVAQGPVWLRVPGWEAWPWLVHGFSTRAGGVSTVYAQPGADGAPHSTDGAPHPGDGELNLGYTADDDPAAVTANRAALVAAVAAPDTMRLVLVRQVHGTQVRTVGEDDVAKLMVEGRAVWDGDALVTGTPGVLLGVQAADCVPILMADTRQRRVAALHAGWRGTAAAIAAAGVETMKAQGSCVTDLVAALGPSIGPCCYAVGPEVRASFERTFGYASELFSQRRGEHYLDLWQANRRQLEDAGLPAARISVLGECSACTLRAGRPAYFSHRGGQGRSGRMMGVIGVRPSSI